MMVAMEAIDHLHTRAQVRDHRLMFPCGTCDFHIEVHGLVNSLFPGR
jgi:hypothetical protein